MTDPEVLITAINFDILHLSGLSKAGTRTELYNP